MANAVSATSLDQNTNTNCNLAATETNFMFFLHERGQSNKMNTHKKHIAIRYQISSRATFRTISGSTCNIPSTPEYNGVLNEDHWTVFAFTEIIQTSSKEFS